MAYERRWMIAAAAVIVTVAVALDRRAPPPEAPMAMVDPVLEGTPARAPAAVPAGAAACATDADCRLAATDSCCGVAAIAGRDYRPELHDRPKVVCRMVCPRRAARCVDGGCRVRPL